MAKQTVTLQQTAIADAIAAGKAQRKADKGMVGKYAAMALVAVGDGTVANADTHSALMLQFVYGYCIEAGDKVSIDSAKGRIVMANPDSATKTDSDNADANKRRARAAFIGGMNRAYADGGYTAPPKQNAGNTTTTTPAATTPATTEPTTANLPPSFMHDLSEANRLLVQFQSTAKLTKADRESIGVIALLIGKCNAAMLPVPAGTPPTVPPLADALDKATTPTA